ncbi:branched-chain amino acid ABC transporter permease [Candidatus Aerophobetes bacterium]|uniref:Branched-chain amino acid ABC transporter permease n=1 Tax=Aerophobetes bacterium TaxID=2030807 RepID=A0A662DK75_UNCAE|nr:MAG: branched-chain amino acid ABC transporter permease [Candidatus Aerophobetes bacterium]
MVIIQALINGVLMGGVYGLTALGLTLIFGVMKVINWAHGSFIMVGMFAGYWLWTLTGIDPYLGLIIIVPALFLLGYFVQDALIKPVFRSEVGVREPIGVLILTAGLWLFIDNFALLLFGPFYRTARTPYSGLTYDVGGLLISAPRLYAFIITIVAAYVLSTFLKKTRLGIAIRATGQDRDTASLMGIDVYRIYNIAFGIGIAITGLVGSLLVPFYYIHPQAGFVFDIRAFIIVVLGGLGSVPGALLGGLLIGLIESVGAQFIPATLTQGIIFAVFLGVLYLRPQGLFGFEKEW